MNIIIDYDLEFKNMSKGILTLTSAPSIIYNPIFEFTNNVDLSIGFFYNSQLLHHGLPAGFIFYDNTSSLLIYGTNAEMTTNAFYTFYNNHSEQLLIDPSPALTYAPDFTFYPYKSFEIIWDFPYEGLIDLTALTVLSPSIGITQVIVKSLHPYVGVSEINGIIRNIYGDVDNYTIEYRFSYNNVEFSNWTTDYDHFVQSIEYRNEESSKLWPEFRITYNGFKKLYVQSVLLDYVSRYMSTPPHCKCSKVAFQKPIIPVTKFDPYDPSIVNKYLDFQKKMSYTATEYFGHDSEYIRIIPDRDYSDYVLMEDGLYKEDRKVPCTKFKLMINNNEFPDTKFNFGPLNIDLFERPFEAHIDVNYFQQKFGEHTAPQKGDIIRLPIENRVYEVKSSTPTKDYMRNILYWRVELGKWERRSNVILSNETKKRLDDYTTGVGELFGAIQKNEVIDKANPDQIVPANRYFDNSRTNIQLEDTWIEKSAYSILSTNIFDYYYDNAKPFKLNKQNHIKLLEYVNNFSFNEKSTLSYNAWFRAVPDFPSSVPVPNSSAVQSLPDSTYVITFAAPIDVVQEFEIGAWIVLRDFNMVDFEVYGKILQMSKFTITIAIMPEMLMVANVKKPNWIATGQYKVEPTATRIFFSNWADGRGILFDSFGTNYYRVQINERYYFINIGTNIVKYNEWSALTLNVSTDFKEVGLSIWQPNPNSKSLRLFKKFKKQINLVGNPVPVWSEESVDPVTMFASNLHLANIRFMKYIINDDQAPIFHTQNVINDASGAYILDNALPISAAGYEGQTRVKTTWNGQR